MMMKTYSPPSFAAYARAFSGAALLLSISMPAWSMRDIEDEIFKASMPHELLGKGQTVRVHYVSRRGVMEAARGESLKGLRSAVQKCAARVQRQGGKVNAPTNWPEEAMIEFRTDSYYALNRSITYERGVSFTVNQDDCSLVETPGASATLRSAKGVCQIDLLKKTASGVCDHKGHADASALPVRPLPGKDEQEAMIKRLKANPATAALADSMLATLPVVPKASGTIKTVAGVKCEMMSAGGPAPGNFCILQGGSFKPSASTLESGQPGIMLENDMPKNGFTVGRKAKLDVDVNAAVFTPYLGTGFRVNDAGGAP